MLDLSLFIKMGFSPHFQLFYFSDRLEFCEFFEWKIKRINNVDLFSQPPLLIFIKGANISGGHCIYKTKWVLFGLVKLIFGLPKSEEYLPEGLPGILKFCEPWC